jgi:hypothetical protein
MIALLGVGTGSDALASMTLVSGVIYLVALVLLGMYFVHRSPEAIRAPVPASATRTPKLT